MIFSSGAHRVRIKERKRIMATRTSTTRRTTTRKTAVKAPVETVEAQADTSIETEGNKSLEVPVEAPETPVDPVVEEPYRIAPYRIESAELQCVNGEVSIRLDLMRGHLHLRLFYPPEYLPHLIGVSDLLNDDADLSDLKGHAVTVGFDANERPTRLANIYDDQEWLRVE